MWILFTIIEVVVNKKQNMKKIVNCLINEAVENVDQYDNDGSIWLIFTEDKRWVIELTKDGTLWYNYRFFKDLFSYVSMDVVKNQNYITEWVEDTIINKVKHTAKMVFGSNGNVEHTIQNGVKHTYLVNMPILVVVEDTIQNGVKHTQKFQANYQDVVEDTIQNGVKHTSSNKILLQSNVEDTIQNGVKNTYKFG